MIRDSTHIVFRNAIEGSSKLASSSPAFRAALTILIFLLATPLMATQWNPRLDLGVAAVERATGKVRWEAWRLDEIPQDASDELKAAAKSLLAKAERFDYEKVPGQVILPAPLTMTQFVRYAYEDLKHQYILTKGSPELPGDEIARFVTKRQTGWQLVARGNTLYIVLDNKVLALKTWDKDKLPEDQRWKPSWKFDLLPALGVDENDRLRHFGVNLYIEGRYLWVIHHHGMLRLDSSGKKNIEFKIKRPWQSVWNGFGTPVTFGRNQIYFRHGKGVIALDKKTGAEKWRFLTTRFPYPSRVAEVDDDLLLVQVGSDTPRTIRAAIIGPKNTIPTILKQTNVKRQVAAAKFIRAYGDGYYRSKLASMEKTWRADRQNIEAADEIIALLKDWPLKRDRRRLIDATVRSLTDRSTTERLFAWTILQGLLYGGTPDSYVRYTAHYAYDRLQDQPLGLTDALRDKLARHCQQVIASGNEEEKAFAASALVSRKVGWDKLSDENLKRLFTSEHPAVWRWTSLALLKNGRRQTLLDWAPLRSDGEQIDLIYVLNQRLPKKLADDELRFWVACAKRTPGRIAYTLSFSMPSTGFKVPAALRGPIRQYLEAEIAKPAVHQQSQQEYDLIAALGVVHKWGDPKDTPLLLKFLRHPDRNEVYVSNGKKWIYTIRNNAKYHLEKRGVTLPADVVYEEPHKS